MSAAMQGIKTSSGEIAKIIDGFTENPLVTRLNGRRCVMISVMREGKQNAITIGERVNWSCHGARVAIEVAAPSMKVPVQ